MNFIKEIILFIKNIFIKENKIKKLENPTIQNNNKELFINSLKINTKETIKNKKIETLICPGDGLGIQKKISS